MKTQNTAAQSHSRQNRINLTILTLILLVFVGPLALAIVLYQKQDLLPLQTHNHGTLINPPKMVQNAPVHETIHQLVDQGSWVIVALAPQDNTQVQNLLTHVAQVQSALGKEERRVKMLYLKSPESPNLVLGPNWSQAEINTPEARLDFGAYLQAPEEGGVFLVDPLGYMVLGYAADEDPHFIYKDLKRLLRLSKVR